MNFYVSFQQLHDLFAFSGLYDVIFGLVAGERNVKGGIRAKMLFNLVQMEHFGHFFRHCIRCHQPIFVDAQQNGNQLVFVLHLFFHQVKPIPKRFQGSAFVDVLLRCLSLHFFSKIRVSFSIVVRLYLGSDFIDELHSRLVYSLVYLAHFSVLLGQERFVLCAHFLIRNFDDAVFTDCSQSGQLDGCFFCNWMGRVANSFRSLLIQQNQITVQPTFPATSSEHEKRRSMS